MNHTRYTTVSRNLWKWDAKQQRHSCPACGSSRVGQHQITDPESDAGWPNNQRMKYECANCSWSTVENADWGSHR